MGGMFSTNSGESKETKKSKALDTKLDVVAEDDGRKIRILVLGLPHSGKSTFIKQVKCLENPKHPFSSEERRKAVGDIVYAAVHNMQILLNQALARGLDPLPTYAQIVLAADPNKPLTSDTARAIAELWSHDEAIKAVYALRAEFELDDSAPIWFTTALSVLTPKWQPSNADMVRVRHRAKAVQMTGLESEMGAEFVWIDVGGLTGTEARKWIHSFSGPVAVVFIANTADYDTLSSSNPEGAYKLQEAMVEFAEAVNAPWFDQAAFFLLLNKTDLFEEKLKKGIPFSFAGSGGAGKDGNTTVRGGAASARTPRLGGQPGPDWGVSGRFTVMSTTSTHQTAAVELPKEIPPRFLDYTAENTSYFSALAYVQERFLELSRRPAHLAVQMHVLSALDPGTTKLAYIEMKKEIYRHYTELGGGERD